MHTENSSLGKVLNLENKATSEINQKSVKNSKPILNPKSHFQDSLKESSKCSSNDLSAENSINGCKNCSDCNQKGPDIKPKIAIEITAFQN